MSRSGCGFLVLLSALAVVIFPCGFVFGQGWSGPEMISSGSRDANSPQVAVGPGGQAVAAFTEWSEVGPDDFRQVTYANLFDGSAWGTAQRIDRLDFAESYDPRVAMDASGRAVAVFAAYTGSQEFIYANRWNGSAWSGPENPASSLTGITLTQPAVAMDGTGKAIAVFTGGGEDFIFASRWNGSAWTVETVGENDTDLPSVAMDAGGHAMAVFRRFDGEVNSIYYRRWNGSSWVWVQQPVVTSILGNVTSASMAMAGDWLSMVVFTQTDGANNRAWFSRWNGTGWTQPTTIDAGAGNTAGSVEVALNANGEAVAVFSQWDGSKERIYANLWDGAAWSGAVTIDTGLWTKGEDAAVAIDGAGRAVAAFAEFSETGPFTGPRKLYAAIYDGSAWSAPARVDRVNDSDSSGRPQVAIDPSGRAIVVFDQEDGYDKHVYANRYVFPPRPSSAWNYDFNGDGTSDIAVFRESSGLWAVRGLTRVYFGRTGDLPSPGDYDGDGTTDIAIFRGSSGLWAVRNGVRVYFGGSSDTPLPRDYGGDGTSEIAIFRGSTGLWAVRGLTRAYFGTAGDDPVPGDYSGDGSAEIGIFRPASGLWAARGMTRAYFGRSGDLPVPAGYDAVPGLDPGIFRPASGLWAAVNGLRHYFGTSGDTPVPADYAGDGIARTGIFRPATGLWALRGLTRIYFGAAGDLPLAR